MIKNILFAYITPFHPERGGIGRVTHSLTLEFQNRGYNVFYLIYPCAITVCHEYNYPAPLEYLPSSDCMSQENVDYYFDYLKRNEIDVVINQSGNFSDSRLWLKAHEVGIKVISALHTPPQVNLTHLWQEVAVLRDDSIMEWYKRLARILLYPKIKKQAIQSRKQHFEYLLPNTDIVCTLSKNDFSAITALCPGFEDKYRSIPNANSYIQNELNISIPNKKKQLLFVGLFSSQKMEQWVLKVWKRVYKDFPDWNLVFVGSQKGTKYDREGSLKRIANKLERVSFVGQQPAFGYQLESSILCVTSIYEGWGLMITEAMQCGTVPIAFKSFAAIDDLIQDTRNGMLVKPFDFDEYERKLRILMSDVDMRESMAKNAINDIQKYDIKNVADMWERLFDEMA